MRSPRRKTIVVGQVWIGRYGAPNRQIKILSIGTAFGGYTSLRPFSTLIEVEYLDGLDGGTAQLPLSFLRANYRCIEELPINS